MWRQIVALYTVLVLLTLPSYQQGSRGSTPTSPCPDVFMYDPPGTEPGWWSGVVTLSSNILLHSVWLNVVLDNQALSLGQLWNWIGNATTQDGIDFRIENEDMEIHPGHPVTARFFIQYDPLNTIPRLRTLRLNGKVICNTDTHQKAPEGRPDISHTNVGQLGSSFWGQKPLTNLDMMPVQTPESEPNYSDNPEPVNDDNAALNFEDGNSKMPEIYARIECGLESSNNIVASLSYKGLGYKRGDVPWLVAIFSDKGNIIRYICAGTLVSDRHIVTVASCVQRGTKNTEDEEELILVKIGIHDLNDKDDNMITRHAHRISIHEDFNKRTFQNDIAVLALYRPVWYNDYIIPVCLWKGDTNLSSVVGATAVVASWSLQNEEVKGLHNEPHKLLVPVVSTDYCSASRYPSKSFNTTLCAGSRNGVGPCKLNSGAGLYLLHNRKWTLRGVASMSLPKFGQGASGTCNLNEYVVYTDAVQFSKWIRNIIAEDL